MVFKKEDNILVFSGVLSKVLVVGFFLSCASAGLEVDALVEVSILTVYIGTTRPYGLDTLSVFQQMKLVIITVSIR